MKDSTSVFETETSRNVLSTNDAVEWSLNEDAVECIRSQHFEIFVRRPYKDSQQKRKKRKKVSEINFSRAANYALS